MELGRVGCWGWGVVNSRSKLWAANWNASHLSSLTLAMRAWTQCPKAVRSSAGGGREGAEMAASSCNRKAGQVERDEESVEFLQECGNGLGWLNFFTCLTMSSAGLGRERKSSRASSTCLAFFLRTGGLLDWEGREGDGSTLPDGTAVCDPASLSSLSSGAAWEGGI